MLKCKKLIIFVGGGESVCVSFLINIFCEVDNNGFYCFLNFSVEDGLLDKLML